MREQDEDILVVSAKFEGLYICAFNSGDGEALPGRLGLSRPCMHEVDLDLEESRRQATNDDIFGTIDVCKAM